MKGVLYVCKFNAHAHVTRSRSMAGNGLGLAAVTRVLRTVAESRYILCSCTLHGEKQLVYC